MPTPTSITDLSQTAASNYPAGTDSPSVLDDVQRAHAAFIALLRDSKGATPVKTLASSSTVDVGGENSYAVEITGTTSITSLGTNYNGPRYLRFTGILTLTHNATLLSLPGTANITTAAGDTALVIPNSTTNGWNMISFMRAAAMPAVVGGDIGAATATTAALGDNSTKVATTAFVLQNSTPIGCIATFPFTAAPAGWLKSNGQTIGSASSGGTLRANADTESLFTLLWSNIANTELPIQDNTGAATTRGASAAADFAANKRLPVPDMRGEFVRGLDDSRGVDSGRALASSQADMIKAHRHNAYNANPIGYGTTGGIRGLTNGAFDGSDNGAQLEGGAETRPRNIALLVCIKY